MFFGKAEKKVIELVRKHSELVGECLDLLVKVVSEYLEGNPECNEVSFAIHQAEHRADEVRREIQTRISQGAFLPFYRTDYILLVDMVDKIANRTVEFSKALITERPLFPKEMHKEILELAEGVVEAGRELRQAVTGLFDDIETAAGLVEDVSAAEQKTDSIEWSLLKKIFSDIEDRGEQLVLRDTVSRLAGIADAAENAADRILITVTKQSS
ncbi:MAG: TIGR00153 family protein [Candidatus Hydrogenedentota bacterium]|nr:MAG: TIGR00153 family protein [Candidatus Hydrogenedentota bacterium]